MTAGRFVGQRIPRVEDQRLLSGHGTYIANMAVPGMLHAIFFRSDIARGKIRSVDTSAAKSFPGVIDVLTATELNHLAGLLHAVFIGAGA